MVDLRNGRRSEKGVRLGDRSERLAAVNDSARRQFAGFTGFIAIMLGVVELGIVVRSVSGRGAQYTGLQIVTSAVGVFVTVGALWLVVRSLRSGTWRPLVIALASCLIWVLLGAALTRI